MSESFGNHINVTRRNLLRGTLAVSVASAVRQRRVVAQRPSPDTNVSSNERDLIQKENSLPGATDWQLTRVRVINTSGGELGYRCPWIEGYCSKQSVAAGESINIMVSTNPPRKFMLEIFRTGYYNGRGARLMRTVGPLAGRTQTDPEVGPNRLRECRWEPSLELEIPETWTSGVYIGRLTTMPESADELYWQSYVIFIVKDNRPADVLFQCSDNTWQAYNRWPDQFSLYDDGNNPWYVGPDVDVSFDRPYGRYRQIYENPQSLGSGEFLCWEFPLSYWLEKHGYDVTYCSNSDLVSPTRGLQCKTFLSVGHDEYWDVRQYHSVKQMISEGVSALFLSGNAVNGVTPFRASIDGRPKRIITRAGRFGGLAAQGVESRHDFPMTGPDEGLLMGARNVSPVNGGGDWTVTRADHWMFEGVGVKNGDSIPGLVGWEYHGAPAKIPGLEIVAEGTALRGGVQPQHWTATIYPGPEGDFVFNAATIFWAQGLSSPPGHMLPWSHWSRPHGPDDRVQRITHNLLRRAIGV
ncbi:MAG: N,N-dimethylformamidase beta subunit family domain-containing protein [Planctomycetota bacterium]